jgi:hypothetical protein
VAWRAPFIAVRGGGRRRCSGGDCGWQNGGGHHGLAPGAKSEHRDSDTAADKRAPRGLNCFQIIQTS